MEDKKKCKINKKEFLELYENSKNGKVDLLTIPSETLKMMCTLLEEEIKIKEKYIKIIEAQLNVD